jgi:uncharacterized membrane protein
MEPERTREERLKTIATIVYALQAGFFLLGVSALVALILNYVKLDDVRGTWLESHFRWQIRTFWFALLWYALAGLTWIVFVGMLVAFANTLWIIYRIIKGWLDLSENQPMYREVSPSPPPASPTDVA